MEKFARHTRVQTENCGKARFAAGASCILSGRSPPRAVTDDNRLYYVDNDGERTKEIWRWSLQPESYNFK